MKVLPSKKTCQELVRTPMDVTPIRSPQAVHTFLLRKMANKDIVEIGTRNGDGMARFAQVARSARAIEMDAQYCARLHTRSAS